MLCLRSYLNFILPVKVPSLRLQTSPVPRLFFRNHSGFSKSLLPKSDFVSTNPYLHVANERISITRLSLRQPECPLPDVVTTHRRVCNKRSISAQQVRTVWLNSLSEKGI